jgi:hypothetical protein
VPARQTGVQYVFSTGAATDFGRNHNVLSPTAEGLAQHLLGVASGVHIRCIEVIDPAVEGSRNNLASQILRINLRNRRLQRCVGSCGRAEGHDARSHPRND